MTDPANCGPVTLSFCQDVQAEAYDWPEAFFEPKVWRIRRPEADAHDLGAVAELIRAAKNPVIVAGGGVIYSGAEEDLADFATRHAIPVIETQAGQVGACPKPSDELWRSRCRWFGCRQRACPQGGSVIGVGTRFQDFTTGSWSLFEADGRKLVSINVQAYDADKHGAIGLVADAKVALAGAFRKTRHPPCARTGCRLAECLACRRDGHCAVLAGAGLPNDAQVIGAVQRATVERAIAMCAAGTMPGALKLLWQPIQGGYHMEYGYSCMGYEIAGAIGLKAGAAVSAR